MVGRDVARSLQDGNVQSLTVPLGPAEVVFNGTKTVPIDRRGITGRLAIDGRGVRYATVIGWDGGSVLVRDDGRLVPMQEGGRFWTAIRPLPVGVEVFAQGPPNADGATATYRVYNEDGGLIRSFTDVYGSMGILQITGANSVRSTVEHTRVVASVRLVFVTTIDGWSVGQFADVVPPGIDPQWGTIALVSPDGQVFYANPAPPWNGYTNMPSHLAVDANGRPYVAINDPTEAWPAPEPTMIDWQPLDPTRGTLEDAIARNRPMPVPPSGPMILTAGNTSALGPIAGVPAELIIGGVIVGLAIIVARQE